MSSWWSFCLLPSAARQTDRCVDSVVQTKNPRASLFVLTPHPTLLFRCWLGICEYANIGHTNRNLRRCVRSLRRTAVVEYYWHVCHPSKFSAPPEISASGSLFVSMFVFLFFYFNFLKLQTAVLLALCLCDSCRFAFVLGRLIFWLLVMGHVSQLKQTSPCSHAMDKKLAWRKTENVGHTKREPCPRQRDAFCISR